MLINILYTVVLPEVCKLFVSAYAPSGLPEVLDELSGLHNFVWPHPHPLRPWGGGGHGSRSAYVEHFLSFLDNEEWSFQETGFVQPDMKRAPSQPESGALVNMIKSETPKTSQKCLQQERKKNESRERGS